MEWLSVKQLVVYHECLTIYKIRKYSKPEYFAWKFGMEQQLIREEQPVSSRTRLHCSGGIRLDSRNVKTNLDKENFCTQSVNSWNRLPVEVRQALSLPSFKRNLREWIKDNVPLR